MAAFKNSALEQWTNTKSFTECLVVLYCRALNPPTPYENQIFISLCILQSAPRRRVYSLLDRRIARASFAHDHGGAGHCCPAHKKWQWRQHQLRFIEDKQLLAR